MLEKNYALNEGEASAAHSIRDELSYVVREKSTRAIHLRNAVVFYATIEFFAVACSAYFGSTFYHVVGRNFFADNTSVRGRGRDYCDLGFGNICSIPQLLRLSKASSAHIFMERYRIGRACVLDFSNDSVFHAVCRSLFTRQLDLPAHQRRLAGYKHTHHILFLASDCNRIKSSGGSTRRSNRRTL